MMFKLDHHFNFGWRIRERFTRSRAASKAGVPQMYVRSEFSEQFRLLALNIISLIGDSPDRSLAVFSLDAQDGRSLVATNLGLALTAHSDVLLVGNTSLSGVHRHLLEPFEMADGNRALVPKAAASEGLHGLWMLPWAQHSAVTRIQRLAATASDAHRDGKFVIVDTPAAKDSADAFLLAQKCTNVLYVMRKGVVDMEPHRRALDQLARLNANVVGIVLNDN